MTDALFQIGVGAVNHPLKAIFAEGELSPEATIRRYRIVQNEGGIDQPRPVDVAFEQMVKQLPKPVPKPRRKKP